jgi:hypothetical protein
MDIIWLAVCTRESETKECIPYLQLDTWLMDPRNQTQQKRGGWLKICLQNEQLALSNYQHSITSAVPSSDPLHSPSIISAHPLPTLCPPSTHPLSALCPPFVHPLSTLCSPSAHSPSILCPPSAHSPSILCPSSAHSLSKTSAQPGKRRYCPYCGW